MVCRRNWSEGQSALTVISNGVTIAPFYPRCSLMSASPRQLLSLVELPVSGSVAWGTSPPTDKAGVYVVSLHGDPNGAAGVAEAPIEEATVAAWIQRVQLLTLDGTRPQPAVLVQRLACYWLPDEAIVYVGKATSLRQRLRQYYSTPLGDRRPHAGGHWIKTLGNLRSLTVHYAETSVAVDPENVERHMLTTFARGMSAATRSAHPQPGLAIPFANLEIKGVGRRNHGIKNSVLRD